MDANALVQAVALRSGLSKGEVDRCLCALQEVVLGTLRKNEDVAVAGFGIWHRPVRDDDTPPFEFVVPVGPLGVTPPPDFKAESDNQPEIERLAAYLTRHSILESTFGTDRDHYPNLDPNVHPGVVASEEVYAAAMSGVRYVFDPEEIGARVVENMKGLVGGRA